MKKLCRSRFCFYHHQFFMVNIIPTVNMGNRRVKKLHYFPASIRACCGGTEMCTQNSQELGGHCSCCTFQLLAEKRRGENVCLHISSESNQTMYVRVLFTAYHSLNTILQLDYFSWEESHLLLGFLPWNTIFPSLPVGLSMPADRGLVQASGSPVAQDFWAQGRQWESAWTSVFID